MSDMKVPDLLFGGTTTRRRIVEANPSTLKSDLRAAVQGIVREIRDALTEPPKPPQGELPLELPEPPPVDMEALREQVKDAFRVELDQRDEAINAAIKDVAVAVASIPTPEPAESGKPRTVYRLDCQRDYKSLLTEINCQPASPDAPAYRFIVHRGYNDLATWIEVKETRAKPARN